METIDRCIGFKELKTYVPYSRAHIPRISAGGEYAGDDPFPSRVQLGKCRVCWWLSEVMDWLRRRPR
jgi:predicted DNA-binding transcriptional regulator AlpA